MFNLINLPPFQSLDSAVFGTFSQDRLCRSAHVCFLNQHRKCSHNQNPFIKRYVTYITLRSVTWFVERPPFSLQSWDPFILKRRCKVRVQHVWKASCLLVWRSYVFTLWSISRAWLLTVFSSRVTRCIMADMSSKLLGGTPEVRKVRESILHTHINVYNILIE